MPPAPPSPFAAVLYEGVRIPLTRTYADIDEFKDDGPTHLSEAALVAIERGMLKARFGPVFRTQAELDASLNRITFPGYGMFYANQLGSKSDSTLELAFVEVPQRSKNRYFAVERENSGTYKVVADFVAPDNPELVRVRKGQGGVLEFLSNSGVVVQRRHAL
jgi:hypothetical protein